MRTYDFGAGYLSARASDGPLRVLVVTPLWPSTHSYAGRQVETLVTSLAAVATNIRVRVAVVEGRSDAKYLRAALAVRREARRFRAHVVVAVYGPTIVSCVGVRAPKVVWLLGSDVNNKRSRVVSKVFAGRRTLPVAVSRSLASAWGRGALVMPNGVDETVFKPADPDDAKASLGLEARDTVMFAAVPGVPTKNFKRFQAVIRLVGPPRTDLQVIHPSGQDSPTKMATLLQAADVVVLTSDQGTEGSPTIVKEALLCGTPVVSVDVGDVATWVERASGAVVPWGPEPELVAGLAVEIRRCLADGKPEAAAAGKLRDELGAEAVARRWVEVLLRLAGSTRDH